MKVIYSPSGIIGTDNPRRGISMMENAGLRNLVMDFSLWRNAKPKEMYGFLKPIYTECNDRDIRFSFAIAPYVVSEAKDYNLNEFLYKLTEECIRVCGETGCKYLIIHPAFAGISIDRLQKVNAEYCRKLVTVAKEMDVVLLLRNQCRNINGHLIRGMFCDAEETIRFIDKINLELETENLAFCLDTGNCNICGQEMYDFISILGNRLKAVILRDNDGKTDGSLLPFTSMGTGGSTTDWMSLIRGLRAVHFDGNIILDFHDSICALPNTLRSKYLELVRDMGVYFKWQLEQEKVLAKYTSRVLFGAGNMCRNYMKCYGADYPPLFTCDNNKQRWGDWFEGLEIKPPESLKELNPGCAIFICNIYYQEIEKQLREMGVSNPIEYFSDEYMPSYYSDRLEYWDGGKL